MKLPRTFTCWLIALVIGASAGERRSAGAVVARDRSRRRRLANDRADVGHAVHGGAARANQFVRLSV